MQSIECPYCFGEIDPKAVACKHCRRSLDFFVPLFRRITEIEYLFDALRQTLDEIVQSFAPQATIDSRSDRLSTRTSAFFVMWAITFTGLLNALYWPLPYPLDEAAFFASYLSTFPIAIWMGFRVRGRHTRGYVLLGALIGLFQVPIIEVTDSLILQRLYMVSEEPIFHLE